jgi:fucose 4-O-acetylase-like acetyltransferase
MQMAKAHAAAALEAPAYSCRMTSPGPRNSFVSAADADRRVEIARAMALFCVFYVHALHGVIDLYKGQPTYWPAVVQVKVLSPHVAVFFALAGMTSQALGSRPWPHVAKRCLMLLLLAFVTHVIGVLILHTLWTPWPSPGGLVRELLRPAVHGTGHSTFVAWFFVALAAARAFGYAWHRGWRVFTVVVACAAAVVALSQSLGLSADFYYWHTWPAAALMFVLGTYLRPEWRVPRLLGFVCLVAGLTLPVLNRPGLWTEGVCLACEPEFTSQPVVGGFGFAPLYFALEVVILIGWLWLAQCLATTPLRQVLVQAGRNSLQLLTLHGWVLLTLYAAAAHVVRSTDFIGRFGGWWLFPTAMVVLAAVHLFLLCLVGRPINALVSACATLSGRAVTLLCRLSVGSRTLRSR